MRKIGLFFTREQLAMRNNCIKAESYQKRGTKSKNRWYYWLFGMFQFIPTRCRNLHLKQFCLEDITPAVLIILIPHIVLAVQWMLIKILSAVINHRGTVITVVSGGCHLMIVLYAKPTQKSRCCDNFSAEIFTEYDRRLPPEWQEPLLGSVQVKRSIRKQGGWII